LRKKVKGRGDRGAKRRSGKDKKASVLSSSTKKKGKGRVRLSVKYRDELQHPWLGRKKKKEKNGVLICTGKKELSSNLWGKNTVLTERVCREVREGGA